MALYFAVIVGLAHLDQGLVVDQDQKNLQLPTDHITVNITVMLTLRNLIIKQTNHTTHQTMTRHLNLDLEAAMVGLSQIFGKTIQTFMALEGRVDLEKNLIDSNSLIVTQVKEEIEEDHTEKVGKKGSHLI